MIAPKDLSDARSAAFAKGESAEPHTPNDLCAVQLFVGFR